MTEPIPFISPRLVGERFQEHAIPLEMLKDLAVLEEMIIEVAKWLFIQDNPGRQRSPRGFTDGISLKLTGIAEGSAIPHIKLFVESKGVYPVTLLPPVNQEYFEKARESIFSAINAASNDETITYHLPENLLGYFDRIGRGLRNNEALEFNPGNHDRPARLDKAIRRKLIFASLQTQELTEDVTLHGMVPEADQNKMTFTLQMIDGIRVNAPLAPQHQKNIIKAFNGYQDGLRIQIQGIGRYDRYNRLLRIDDVEHITILDPLDVVSRLNEFRKLKDGWLDGCGIAPSHDALNWFSDRFENNFSDDLPLPHLYPTEEGGVQAEWTLGQYEVSLDVDLRTHTGTWHNMNMESATSEDQTFNLDIADSWKMLESMILKLAKVTT